MSNRCDCPQPPGGEVVCENHQLALCIVQNGKAQYHCLNPPNSGNSLVLINWTLQSITGDRKRPLSLVSRSEIRMLNRGVYSDGNAQASFRLPDKLQKALDELSNRGGALEA